jgi:hypothetical protein
MLLQPFPLHANFMETNFMLNKYDCPSKLLQGQFNSSTLVQNLPEYDCAKPRHCCGQATHFFKLKETERWHLTYEQKNVLSSVTAKILKKGEHYI